MINASSQCEKALWYPTTIDWTIISTIYRLEYLFLPSSTLSVYGRKSSRDANLKYFHVIVKSLCLAYIYLLYITNVIYYCFYVEINCNFVYCVFALSGSRRIGLLTLKKLNKRTSNSIQEQALPLPKKGTMQWSHR